MIVGTAGHIDHGKTTLVRALTGVDTDRLKEEKARGITVDLGFAYMPGPGGEPIGFVDVPGHERLVRTMVAGAAGIDFALLAIAADDGVMPQTREHLEILELLGLTRGVIAVTKVDRVEAARRAAVRDEIAAAVAGTPFARFEAQPVSAATGEGMEGLRARLLAAATQSSTVGSAGVFRMPVDRSFSIAGIGTVVTGTALRGQVAVGDTITVLPGARPARVRSLHVGNREAARGVAGERCALALTGAGVNRETVGRGSWICGGAAPFATDRFDADVRLLAGEARSLRDGTPVHLHCGASDLIARVQILADRPLEPGGRALAQVALQGTLPVRNGDVFVLRDASGQRTIGGGTVLDPRAPLRRRRSPERLARLAALGARDAPAALAGLLALAPGFEDLDAFAVERGLAPSEAACIPDELGLATLRGEATVVFEPARWTRLAEEITGRLADFHAANPELPGMAGERLRLALEPGLSKSLFAAVRQQLIGEGVIGSQGHWLRLPEHVAELGQADRLIADQLLPLVREERFRPPRVRDIGAAISEGEADVRRACKQLARMGELVEIAHDHYFLQRAVIEMAGIADALTRAGETGLFAAADFRDKLGNGRKVAIQILEFFDREGLTQRSGDLRRVVKAPEAIFGPGPGTV